MNSIFLCTVVVFFLNSYLWLKNQKRKKYHYLHVLFNLFDILVSTCLTKFPRSLRSLNSSKTPSTGVRLATRAHGTHSTPISSEHLFFPGLHTTVYWIPHIWHTLYTYRDHMEFYSGWFFVLPHTSPNMQLLIHEFKNPYTFMSLWKCLKISQDHAPQTFYCTFDDITICFKVHMAHP